MHAAAAARPTLLPTSVDPVLAPSPSLAPVLVLVLVLTLDLTHDLTHVSALAPDPASPAVQRWQMDFARTRAGSLATTRPPLLVLGKAGQAATDDERRGTGFGMMGGSKTRSLLLTIMASNTDWVNSYELAVADLRMHLDAVARHRRMIDSVGQDDHAIARVRALDRRLYDTHLPGDLFQQFDTRRVSTPLTSETQTSPNPPASRALTPTPASDTRAHTPEHVRTPTPAPTPAHTPSPSPVSAPPRRPRPSAASAEEDIQALLGANLWQSPLSSAQIAQLAGLSSTQTRRRRIALANAVRGVAPGITADSWKEAFARSADSEDLFALQQEFLVGKQSISVLALQHNFTGEFAFVNRMLLKLFDVTLARRWYASSTHDSQFATHFYRRLWAETEEGRAALASGPAEQVFKDRKKDINKFARSQQVHVTARNRLLRLFARFGPIVLLDPCWEYDILLSTTNGPKAMNTALAYYEAFVNETSRGTRQKLYLRAEEAVIALTAAAWRRPEYTDIVRGQLWELRVHAAVAFT
ncbi:uncharacterized protein SCHCODRAFT_02666302 [Schizophyllum commune H4-8]|uniref:Uncharacterized protein n=1 Tax=Schizophyllum commune (strain H4-8 / FGSC 9210) TaxID=578458 RepID=D8PND4_SCHCM|nr:uncharacterized protein SCHCODRAFT_02666302 [Schizophyllum commune H4-8]KAI5893161.1 hypothetical protein SCHCODRAFT_02666302 [Schizophyllum commune H4-8]